MRIGYYKGAGTKIYNELFLLLKSINLEGKKGKLAIDFCSLLKDKTDLKL